MRWSKLKDKSRMILKPLVKAFSFIPPNFITFGGFVIVLVSAIIILNGKFRIAGIILIAGSILDALDGQIARAKGKTSKFGAFFDSTLDRYGEFFIFFSIAFAENNNIMTAMCFAAVLGAFLTSYTRARAESLGYDIKEGFFTRVERMIFVIGGLIIFPHKMIYVIAILAIGSNITAIQRILIAYKRLENGGI
ncbi:MAG: CDP-alcohol phosphatidyltransferase family protein [candidate division WOR-3 bacterium]|jgi:CDP-diacylglycerol---glycerol-3-phosphate 3-phosphatidyltransferase